MSIIESNKLDSIGIDRNTNKVMLTISDHLDWKDEEHHLLSLQEKINSYIQFIESGQIYDSYPDSLNRKIVIDIICKYDFPKIGIEFLDKIKPLLRSLNIGLKHSILSNGDL